MEPIVKVEQGQVRGRTLTLASGREIYGFLGVPYAKPPLGDLRFRPPVQLGNWDGVHDATKTGKACIQLDRLANVQIGDEDCLYINIYTPTLPSQDSKPLPVMVYIHGGGFVMGSGDLSSASPKFLVEKDVVFVSFNYRLGILGFLNLDIPEAIGNAGLKDQLMALNWVQKNIKEFNGDPENVTIFGVSAGGASVEYLLLSPMAKGLFHKAIIESGSSLNPWAINQPKNIRKYAFSIGEKCDEEFVNEKDLCSFLKKIPAEELLQLSLDVLPVEKSECLLFAYVPSIEKVTDLCDNFITEDTLELLKKGPINRVPIISGFCTHEGLMMEVGSSELIKRIVCDKNNLSDYIPRGMEINNIEHLNTYLEEAYLKPSRDEPDFIAIDFLTDLEFLGGIYVASKLLSRFTSPVFFYQFAYDGNLNFLKLFCNVKRKGAIHADEVGYLISPFNEMPEIFKPPGGFPEPTDLDVLVRERMTTMWTNFAKYGNPTPDLDDVITTRWEPIQENRFQYLMIDENLTMKSNLYPKRMKIYQDAYIGE